MKADNHINIQKLKKKESQFYRQTTLRLTDNKDGLNYRQTEQKTDKETDSHTCKHRDMKDLLSYGRKLR